MPLQIIGAHTYDHTPLHARRGACAARSPLAGADTEQAVLIVVSAFGPFVAELRNHAEIVLGSGAAVAWGYQPSLIRCFAEGRAMDPPEGSIRGESVSHRCGI